LCSKGLFSAGRLTRGKENGGSRGFMKGRRSRPPPSYQNRQCLTPEKEVAIEFCKKKKKRRQSPEERRLLGKKRKKEFPSREKF